MAEILCRILHHSGTYHIDTEASFQLYCCRQHKTVQGTAYQSSTGNSFGRSVGKNPGSEDKAAVVVQVVLSCKYYVYLSQQFAFHIDEQVHFRQGTEIIHTSRSGGTYTSIKGFYFLIHLLYGLFGRNIHTDISAVPSCRNDLVFSRKGFCNFFSYSAVGSYNQYLH